MRRVEVRVLGEVLVVGREKAVQRGRVVHADVLVANAGAKREVLAIRPGAQRERAAIPVLESGADVPGLSAELELGVERPALEPPRQVESPGQRVMIRGIEVERRAGVE